MVDRHLPHHWMMRVLFLLICTLIIFLQLLPFGTIGSRWAGPDLIVALSFAWLLRRPEYVPLFLLLSVVLLTDFLFQRPPGLWAALFVIGSETLRGRVQFLRDLTFTSEWASVASTLLLMTLAYRIVLWVLMVPQAPFGLSLMQLLLTLLVYPLVVFLSHVLLGVRKPAAGDLDALGRRV